MTKKTSLNLLLMILFHVPFILLEGKFRLERSVKYRFNLFYRNIWKINSGICQLDKMAKHMLTLTTCTGGEQFTCDDGTCVRMNQVQILLISVNNVPGNTEVQSCDGLPRLQR